MFYLPKDNQFLPLNTEEKHFYTLLQYFPKVKISPKNDGRLITKAASFYKFYNISIHFYKISYTRAKVFIHSTSVYIWEVYTARL